MERPNLARKDPLNPQEAIEYFTLSRRRFYDLIKKGNLNFIAYYGERKLIIRGEFEKYLMNHPEIRRQPNGKLKKR